MVLGQQIKVTGTNGTPVSQAVVVIKSLSDKKENIFLTDNSGSASIGTYLQKVQIYISHVSYQEVVDTLNAINSDLIIKMIAKDVKLNEVVVSSDYTPRMAGESVHTVAVINKQQIDNQGASNLEEVLNQQLNIRVSQDQVLGSGMTMNGLSGQNIKYLVDGVPVIGRLDGNIDLSQILLSNVERIEVVNGPMATAYGTDAAGGVINVITKQPTNEKFEGGVNLLYENIGRYNLDASAGTSKGKSAFQLSGGRNFFDGWSAVDTGRWQEWKPKEQLFGTIKYRYTGKKTILSYQFNAFDEKISNKGTPRISPYYAYAFDEYYKTKRYSNQLNISYILKRDLFANATFSYSYYDRTKNTYRKDLVTLNENLVLSQANNDSTGQSGALANQDTTQMHTWMARGTISKSETNAAINYQAGYDVNIENASGTRFKELVKQTGDFAVFASAEYNANSHLEIKPAIRISYNTDYKSPVVPSFLIKYSFTDNLIARFSYGKGFRAPGIKERYLYFVDINHNIRGNENLLPEYSDNFYGSLHQQITKGKISDAVELSGFFNDTRNLITLAQPDPSSSLYTYINLGKFSTHGVGLTNTINYHDLSVQLGAAYTGRYNIYADSGNFAKYIYSPDFNAMIQYSFSKLNLSASLFFKYNGKLPGYKLNEDNTISQFSNESYKFLDATIRKGLFKKSFYITTGVRNILNITNVSAFAQGSAHSTSSDEQAVGTGRSYFVKLQYLFGK